MGGHTHYPHKGLTVEFLARHRDELGRHYILPTPDIGVIQTIVNKKPLYDVAKTRSRCSQDFLP